MNINSKKAGFTLVELLISVAIMGLIVGVLYQVIGVTLSSYHAADDRAVLVPQARYALERMVTFVQESDYIVAPDTTSTTNVLTVSERLSDQYTNATRVYAVAGDGVPDADADSDGLISLIINNGVEVPAETITFYLDDADTTNICLKEKMPDYGTSQPGDQKAGIIICEHVTTFACRRLSAGIVEITLTLQQGSQAVTLRTTAKARWVD